MKTLPHIVVIIGPTASGKTSLALSLARERDGEIVNADSRQVYRGMDVGTGKSDMGGERVFGEGKGLHCFDVADPDEDYSLALWKADAETAIDDILARGKLPIVVGGTGLYVRALVENLEMPDVPPDPLLRASLDVMTREELFAELQKRDPETALVIDEKNPRRLIRALEVVMKTGESFTALGKKGELRYEAEIIGLHPTPEDLHHRIAARVDAMVDAGLLDEARSLFAKYDPALPSLSGIGYPEARLCLDGTIDIDEMKARIVKNSLAYAKRQMTYFKKLPGVAWRNV